MLAREIDLLELFIENERSTSVGESKVVGEGDDGWHAGSLEEVRLDSLLKRSLDGVLADHVREHHEGVR